MDEARRPGTVASDAERRAGVAPAGRGGPTRAGSMCAAARVGGLSAPWRNRDFMLYWAGLALSTLGTNMSGLAYPLLLLAVTGSPALAGVAGLLRAAPFALLSLPAGALVDRLDRRRVMLAADAGRALALGSIPLAWWTGCLSLAQIYVAATVEGALLVFYHTAHIAALPRLVPGAQLAAASAQEEASYYAAALVGPPAGGALYGVGRALPFAADALSYVCSVLSLLLIRTDLGRSEAPQGGLGGDIRDGLRWLWRQPLIRALSLLDVPETLVASGSALLVVVLAQRQHASATTIGTVFAVAGVGGILGAIAGAHAARRLGFGSIMLGVRWLAALLWPLYALAPSPLALGLITAGLFFLNPVKNVALVSYTLPQIPERLRARVTALWDLLPAATASLGAGLMGLALQALGPTPTVLAAAAVMLLLAAAVTLNRPIRQAPPLAEARAR